MVGYAIASVPQRPDWLEALLTDKFFNPCLKHAASKKNERNIFCVDCCDSICQHCLPVHQTHRLLQIRRYVYHDVIRLQDVQKLVDCSLVQAYIINSARVVFLNQRPQPRLAKGQGNACETCERSLQDAYRYCSVACKIDAYIAQARDLAAILPRCNSLAFPDFVPSSPTDSLKAGKAELEEEDFSPTSSALEEPQSQTSSGFTANDDSGGSTESPAVTSTATTTLPAPKKVRSSRPAGPVSPRSVIPSSCKRRKGTPHRSPIY